MSGFLVKMSTVTVRYKKCLAYLLWVAPCPPVGSLASAQVMCQISLLAQIDSCQLLMEANNALESSAAPQREAQQLLRGKLSSSLRRFMELSSSPKVTHSSLTPQVYSFATLHLSNLATQQHSSSAAPQLHNYTTPVVQGQGGKIT